MLSGAVCLAVLILILTRTGESCGFEAEHQHGAMIQQQEVGEADGSYGAEEADCFYGAEVDPCWGLRCLRGPGEMCGGILEKNKG